MPPRVLASGPKPCGGKNISVLTTPVPYHNVQFGSSCVRACKVDSLQSAIFLFFALVGRRVTSLVENFLCPYRERFLKLYFLGCQDYRFC